MSSYITKKTPGETVWFRHDRFGMFIHWGVYSMPARGEWVRYAEQITNEQYEKYVGHFDPDLYDPREWAKKAKAAGMKYAVFTTKHHDGFCLFDSQHTDYKSTNTKVGRDLVREYVDAFRAEGLKIGFYYSLLDWHHPDFIIDDPHPLHAHPEAEQMNQGRDMKRYAKYMRDQLTELMSNYGKIHILWLDFSYPDNNGHEPWMKGKGKDDWESEALIKTVRDLQPGIIIDNRADIEQDVWTPEQYQIKSWMRHPDTKEYLTWEVCHTAIGPNWGYDRDTGIEKSPETLIAALINSVSLGGNMLINFGPTARGYMDNRAEKALDVFAKWMKYNSRAIYGCTMAEPELLPLCPEGCKFTQSEDGKRLYIHLMEYPLSVLELPGFADKVEYAQFLHDGSELIMSAKLSTISIGVTEGENMLGIHLPVKKPDVTVPVVELFLK